MAPYRTQEQTVERANTLFTTGFNCSQASMASLREAFVATHVPPSIAACFGGGVGSSGGPCGILTGSLMALGLACGYNDPAHPELKTLSSNLAAELIAAFERQAGAIACAELTGRRTEGTAEERRVPPGTKERVCIPMMKSWVAFCHEFMAARKLGCPTSEL